MITSDALLQSLKTDLLGQGLPFQGEFWPGMSITEAAAVSISNSLLKKWEYEATDAADSAALVKFLEANQRCENWTLPDYSSLTETDSWKAEMLLHGFKVAVDSFWFCRRDGFETGNYGLVDDLREVFETSRVGPGANILARSGDFYSKLFSSPLTCSNSSLAFWYKHCISRLPEWHLAEEARQAAYGSARVVRGSRLSFVPKNDKISRCICTEPTLNTWFQLGLGEILKRRLRSRFGIDLDDQQFKNRELARLGSLTDGLSTIDLSSASDSISLRMLKWALPTDMYRMLVSLRTPVSEIPGLGAMELHMVSTMGNGYTFPLQTLLFACAVVACMHFRGIPERRNRSDSLWGVYGDDIICPSSVTDDVIFLLNLLGFRVNDDKSFVKGPFRESCGADFYRGTDIRGVYVKRLADPSDLFVVVNLLIRFSTKTGISCRNTVNLLLSALPGRLGRYCVPPWENIDSGIQVPWSFAKSFVRSRNGFKTYFSRVVRPQRIRIMDDGYVVVPRRHKQLIYNPSGLMVSFLQQAINGSRGRAGVSGYIGVREDNLKRTTKRRVTSMWHFLGAPSSVYRLIHRKTGLGEPEGWETAPLDWEQWETTVSDHFSEEVTE